MISSVENIFRRCTEAALSGNGELVRYLLSRLIDRALADESLLEWVQTRSYLHSNGFDKIVLWGDGEKSRKLRLHYWSGNAISTPTIHSHSWNFTSYVILGGIEVTHYDPDDTGQEFWSYRIASRDDARSDATVRMRRRASVQFTQNDVYVESTQAFHDVLPIGETVTFVMQDAHTLPGSVMLCPAPLEGPPETQNIPRIDRERLTSVMARVLDLLD